MENLVQKSFKKYCNHFCGFLTLLYLAIGFFLIFSRCNKQSTPPQKIVLKDSVCPHEKNFEKSRFTQFEKELIRKGLICIIDSIPLIHEDLRYATANNFTGQILYDSLQHAFLQKDAALKLFEAQHILHRTDSTLDLYIFDALRPQRFQFMMWKIVKGTDFQRYVASPHAGSVHNFGCAVDLTIIKDDSVLLDMGTGYDYFGKLSQPRHNQFFLNEGKLTKEQIKNRQFLRNIMKQAGFQPINSEWWHFNAFPKEYVRKNFEMVK